VVFWFKPRGTAIPAGWQPCDSSLNTYIPQFSTSLNDVAPVGNFHIEPSPTRGQDNISIHKVMCLQQQ
jgi:hypothetical protein